MKILVLGLILLNATVSFSADANKNIQSACKIEVTQREIRLTLQRLDNFETDVFLQSPYKTTKELTEKINEYSDWVGSLRKEGICYQP